MLLPELFAVSEAVPEVASSSFFLGGRPRLLGFTSVSLESVSVFMVLLLSAKLPVLLLPLSALLFVPDEASLSAI